MLTLSQVDLTHKRVLIREDFNVPLQNGVIGNDKRIDAALATINFALQHQAAVILLSHLGRPTEGKSQNIDSLAPVADALAAKLKQPVRFVTDYLHGVDIQPGEVVLCENVRFNVGEKANDSTLAKQYAALCDVFVMDAFATAHRAQASTQGVANYAPIACAGPLLEQELNALTCALDAPKRPLIAIVGGAKVSTKLGVLNSIIDKVDVLMLGGGIANTFIAAAGHPVGKSLYQAHQLNDVKAMLTKAEQHNVRIPMPCDVIVATEFSQSAKASMKRLRDVNADDMILDIGPATAKQYSEILLNAKTILWNGPVGVFEWPDFAHGTATIANAIASSAAFSIAGGGDTLAAIDHWQLADKISYISTGGGAFLEFVEGKTLPAVQILQQRAQDNSA